MAVAAHQSLALAGMAAGSVLALVALWASSRAWIRHRNLIDGAMSVAALLWLAHLVVTMAVQSGGNHQHLAYATDAGFQMLIIAVSFFLLASAGLTGRWTYGLLTVQALAGAVLLHWHHWGAVGQPQAHAAWVAINFLSAVCLTAAIAWQVHATRELRCWLALAGCLIGLGICVDGVLMGDEPMRTLTLSHHFYAAFLLVMWHLVTPRTEAEEPLFVSSSGFYAMTGPAGSPDAAASAVAGERRRIAQDLHDGVGSQIVNILSSLDSSTPDQQAMALALENCLLDLKMTVDGIDGANDSVPEALGRLRYRVQHSLDRLGIRMEWNVDICDELEAVRGDAARQVLRIAQESISNVMRHAQASVVEVACRFCPAPDRMMLEVRDNGRGIAHQRCVQASGKGFVSMRRRAELIGGELLISSKQGGGTRVRFVLPLTHDQPVSA